MITKYKVLAQNLFLCMAGQELSSKSYDLEAEYRKVLDDDSASLKGICRL
jgi:hypothetical protein